MKLNLESSQQEMPPISDVIVHDKEGKLLFQLTFSDQQLQFEDTTEDITDVLIETKDVLTTEKGVEAIGSLIIGASEETAVYRHFLTIYQPKAGGDFDKLHLTLTSQLQQLDLSHLLLLAAEAYTVLMGPLQDYLNANTLDPSKYSLLRSFFTRNYDYTPYQQRMDKIQKGEGDPTLVQLYNQLVTTVATEKIEAAVMSIMTISGAIMAELPLKGTINRQDIINLLNSNSIHSPGVITNDGVMVIFYPFTRSKVGKVSRAINTTLISLSYATGKQQSAEQTQKNIAHKFVDMVDIVGNSDGKGLKTNVGHLVCSLRFQEGIKNNLMEMTTISQPLLEPVKQLGQTLLRQVAKEEGFGNIQ